MRKDNRAFDNEREIEIIPNYLENCQASCLIKCGNTHVICSATYSNYTPRFVRGSGKGWLTAEYSMLPTCSQRRIEREVSKGRPSGRTQEIQRLIGRSLRSCLDMSLLGENQIIIDCDVINADGGTRTASISGAFVALKILINDLLIRKAIRVNPIKYNIAAISCGIYNGKPLVDLDYSEDSTCQSDANFVMNEKGEFLEVQITAEGKSFSIAELTNLSQLAQNSINRIIIQQNEVF